MLGMKKMRGNIQEFASTRQGRLCRSFTGNQLFHLMFFKAQKGRATSSGKLLSGDDDGPISLTH